MHYPPKEKTPRVARSGTVVAKVLATTTTSTARSNAKGSASASSSGECLCSSWRCRSAYTVHASRRFREPFPRSSSASAAGYRPLIIDAIMTGHEVGSLSIITFGVSYSPHSRYSIR